MTIQFQRRLKGQRYDKRLLPWALVQSADDPSVCFDEFLSENPHRFPMQVLEDFSGFDPWGNPCVYELIAVTLPCGTLVPACRRKDPSNAYCICQSFTYKSFKPAC